MNIFSSIVKFWPAVFFANDFAKAKSRWYNIFWLCRNAQEKHLREHHCVSAMHDET